ncbi:MAG: T9SS type B sorting domain-containing protein [Chitinophagaceae bacterium]|nr:T9SS type B sorting domain-containing protein [Chitinophagaceae bacterium]
MRKFYLLSTLVLLAILYSGKTVQAQDFSNKGKDFWVGYGYHQIMTGGANAQNMVLYFAADVNSNVTVTIPALGYTANYFVAAGTVVTSSPIPKIAPQDARLLTEGVSNNGIHITSDKAIVAYAHVYNQSVSGATILFPTNTLGTEYYSINFENLSNTTGANCWFYVVATDPGVTDVKITPSANTTGGWIAGNTYSVSLTQGQIYNVMGTYSGNSGVDLTGSLVQATGGAGGCNRIAVFSGSGRINIACGGPSSTSSDNYMVQAVPKAAWGTKYLTSPTSTLTNNFFRICVSSPLAAVRLNGVPIGLPLQNGFYYQVGPTSSPLLIESDSVITVAQYITSQSSCGNGAPGDPEVIYLSPVQQSINKVLWNATPNFAISQHFYNVIIPNKGTGLSSFTLDGVPVPAGLFTVHPQEPDYSYLSQLVNPGQHIMQSDSGFNAMAYGFGNFESYGYNAGTNVKDLYQQIGVSTQFGVEVSPTVCVGLDFKFKVSLPYCADSIQWTLPPPLTSPATQIYASCAAADSTTIVNGKTIYWYSLPFTYSFAAVGSYPVNIRVYAPNAGSCGNVQEIDFDLEVIDLPTPDFSYVVGGCAAEPVQFTETTPQAPKTTYSFYWNFGDPASGAANISNLRNPVHTFSAPGSYTVKYSAITTPGCITDTAVHVVNIPANPTATISATATNVCVGGTASVTFVGVDGTPPYTYYYTVNPGGPASVNGGGSVSIPVNTAAPGTFIYTLDSIRNQGSAICVNTITGQSVTVTVNPDHAMSLTSGNANQAACVNIAIANITYTLSGGATGATVTGLPPGVTFSVAGTTLTISGTPSTAVGSPFNFTVNTTGNACVPATANGTITISPDHAINLTSGNASQAVCVNVAITPITYTLSGGATGGTVSGLPAGVTSSVAGTTLTISGTPTATGTFNFTVNTTGNSCVAASATGTLTVNPAHAVNLTSGNASQAVCINTAIAAITYTLAGGATGGTVTGLPAGVTGSVAGTTLTISGTPTVAGTFNFTVNTSGNICAPASANGTLTVNPDHTINLTSGNANQTVCVNTAIAAITYTLSAGATGGTATGLPAGVTGSVAGTTLTISGTPTATGTFNFTVNTTGNACVAASATGTLTVNPAHAVNLTSGNANQAVCINTAIAAITYTLAGGATGGTVAGLPAGVTGSVAGTTLTISGTPTAAGTFNFTVTTSGNACAGATANGTLTVNPDHAINLTSGNASQTVCVNTAIVAITYTLSGGATGGTVSGLPAGVTGSVAGTTLTISGTPTATGTFNFTVNTTGNACVPASATGTLTVNPAHAVNLTSGNASQTVCVNVAIAPITYTLSGGATGGTVTGLPAGVTGSVAGTLLTISGTPTVAGTFNFTLNTTGNACAVASANGTLTVNPDHAINLTSGNANQAVCINTALNNITYTLAGGATGATVTGLPAGVTFSVTGTTLTISGTPTTGGTFNYTINTTGNSCIAATANGTITVTAAHAVNLTSGSANQTVCVNTAITTVTYTLGGGATGATVSGLPAGVASSVVGTTLTISGTPTGTGTFNFTINTTGNACAVASSNGSITVNPDHTINLASGSTSQTVCVNTAIASITYTLGGGATGGTVSGLPAGVTGSVAGTTLTVSGTPTVTGTFNFTITTTGNACITASASGTITVNPVHAMALSSAPATTNQTVCVNIAIANITYTLSGGATGATVTGLPAGITSSVAGSTVTISGTPTASGTFNFTVNTTGNACAAASANGTITVNPDHAISLASANATQTVCINTVIANITYTLSGGATGGNVTGLPAGVTASVAGTTLTISGTPTAAGTFNFTVTTTGNSCIVASSTGIITVTPAQAVNLTSGNASQTRCVNTAITNITYTLSGGATGATVTGLPAGVNSSLVGSTLTISGTPSTSVGSPFSFTITTSGNSCTPSVANGTITVEADHVMNLTSAASTTNQTVCTDRQMTPITYSINGGATGANVTGLPPGVTSSVAGGILTISGSPTSIAGSPFNYSITTTGNGCVQANANGSISVLQTPAVQFDPVPGICQDAPQFNVTGLPAGGTFSGPGIDAAGLFKPSVAGAGDHVITYSYTAANGCENSRTQTISVYPLPIVDAGPDRGVIEGGQITLTPVITANFPVTYLWTPALYLSNPNIANPVVSGLPDDRIYTLLVTSDKGCSATDIVFVKLLRRIEIPNIFSPNGDGIHDTWMIQYLDSYPGCTVEIFNRYGQRIFQSEGYSKPWDGTINGKPVPVGTYYYIINPKNGRSQMSGYVDVIR